MTDTRTTRLDGPYLAYQLRRLVDRLFISVGEDADLDVTSILRNLSQEVELLARSVEAHT